MCIWKIIKLAYSLNYKQLQLSTSVGYRPTEKEQLWFSNFIIYTNHSRGTFKKRNISFYLLVIGTRFTVIKQFERTFDTFQATLTWRESVLSFPLCSSEERSTSLYSSAAAAYSPEELEHVEIHKSHHSQCYSVICNLKNFTRKRIILTLIMAIIIDFSLLEFCTCWTTNCPIPNLITHYFCRLKNLTLN